MWFDKIKSTDTIDFAISMYHDKYYFLDGLFDPV